MSAPVAPAPDAEALAALCRQRQWNAVIDRARAHPSDVKAAVATRGRLPPLHIACENGAPIQVIKALFAANVSAAQRKAGLHDRLPLHCLLAAADKFPLNDAVVLALVEAFPGACREPDKAGSLPIHLACQAAPVSDDIFTSLLSMYPEGAYAKTQAGLYPLHLAAANKHVETKKIALAALDRGTLYASISKMTALCLSKEHEERTKKLERTQADKWKKMETQTKEERSKLKSQIEALQAQLKSEKKGNAKLQEEKKAAALKHEENLALTVKNEQTKASEMERGLREELAEVQLTNMDLIEEVESVQAELAGELKKVQDKLSLAEASNEEKNECIQHLEGSLTSSKESVLALVEEQERMNAAMTTQREALASLLLGQDTAIRDAGALKERMARLAVDIGQATKKDKGSGEEAQIKEEEGANEQ